MAFGDYKPCDLCKEKAFYDANIEDSRYVSTYDPSQKEEWMGTIAIGVLCPSCAKTHEIVIRKRETA